MQGNTSPSNATNNDLSIVSNPIASPLDLPCGATLPNRLCKSAMTEGLADPHDRPSRALMKLYHTWSQGGTGLHITGNVLIDRRYLERAGNVVLEDDKDLELFQEWAKQGQSGGNHLWVQLNHPGRQCPRIVNPRPLSPSDVHLEMMGNFGKPKPMTEDNIQEVIQRFVNSARLVKQAGFSGVQVHSAHGYLLSQFLSPKINQRKDKWGGSLENRARLLRTIIQEIRIALGPEYPIGVKLNSADFQKGGFTSEECTQVAQWLAEDSVDLLEISGGTYEQLSLIGVEPTEVRESTRKREAYFIEYAAQIKKATNIPLLVTGGFRSKEVMEQALRSGEIDAIGLARPLCTQTDCSTKLISGEASQLDSYEHQLVLGTGIWGNNSPLALIKAINNVGQVGFYYWQIVRLSDGLSPDPKTTPFKYFIWHLSRDFKMNIKRKRAAKVSGNRRI